VKVVADSSPLIILARVGCFDQIAKSYKRVFISEQVYGEIVVGVAPLPGAAEVTKADWIEVRKLRQPDLLASQSETHLGIGELSTLALAREIAADVVFLDDLKARKLAIEFGFAVRGTVGLLESFYRRGDIDDLRAVFGRLLASGAYIDSALLNSRLEALGLAPL
jgi:predicted nucleic acid-binding protein